MPPFNSEQAVAHLAAIVESSDDAIISKTLDGVILTWNVGAERVYGYAAADAIGQPMTLVLPDDRSNEEAEILDRIRRGDRVEHFETVRRTKNGDLIDVSLTISPIRDETGRVIAASHVARDITDRKRLDVRFQQLAAIVESSRDAIISETVEGTILTWNAGAEHVYGYSAADAIGQPMALLLPEDRADEETGILERIRNGERVEHFETVRCTNSGDLIEVSLRISPICDKDGRIVGASHVARDITERKRFEEQLRHTQKLESLGVLAGGVAHDFNNLLTGIMGNTSLVLDTLPANSEFRRPLRDVINASERASHLTRQLLAYAGKGQFVVEPVNLSALVREISTLIQTSIPKDVQLRLELRDDVPHVHADSSQLQQLIMNLVINGAEAIGPDRRGSVLVTTAARILDGHEVPGASADSAELPAGTYVSLEVQDTGTGMDEATLGRIFDPFFTTKFTGRGLGLAAVQGIVRGHKGTMKVDSRPGKGTTFTVLLPATDKAAMPKPPARARAAAKGSELVLVIDDEEIIRSTAKSMLEHHGYAVVAAENGQEGVELFEAMADKVAAVILDMTMPVMSGEETFRHLIERRPGLKVILSSGYSEAEAVRRFRGKGLAGFLQKPYSAASLLEKVRSVIEAPARSAENRAAH